MTFTLTEDHIKLISNLHLVSYTDFGPEICSKRPFGNSSIECDIANILKWETEDGELTEKQVSDAWKIFNEELPNALQIVLCTKTFEPGTYQKDNKYDELSWTKVKD